MQYPKPIMTITELVPLGFTKHYLKRVCHVKGQDFAKKTPGGGKYYFDVEKFEKWRNSVNL